VSLRRAAPIWTKPSYDSEDDQPNTINGLTSPEMKTVLQRVSDNKVSGWELDAEALINVLDSERYASGWSLLLSTPDAEHQIIDLHTHTFRCS